MQDWRTMPGMIVLYTYKRKFAYLPVKCGEERVWLKPYYQVWNTYEYYSKIFHPEHSKNITEADFIVKKLS